MIAPLSGDLQDLGSGAFGYLVSVAGRTESLYEHVAECSGRCQRPFRGRQPVTVGGKSECSIACHHGGGGIAGITGASSNRRVAVAVLSAGGHLGVEPARAPRAGARTRSCRRQSAVEPSTGRRGRRRALGFPAPP